MAVVSLKRREHEEINTIRWVEFDERGNALSDWLLPELKAKLKGSRFAMIHVDTAYNVMAQTAIVFGPMGLTSLTQTAGNAQRIAPAPFAIDNWQRHDRRIVKAFGTPEGRTAKRRFLSQLDQRILKTLVRCHALDSALYNWCLIDPERRCAALLSYPAFARRFVTEPVEMAIALSGSLENALSSTLNQSNAVIRHAGRMPSAALTEHDQDRVMDLMEILPPSHWPATRHAARQMIKLADDCIQIGDAHVMDSVSAQVFKQTILSKATPWTDIDWHAFNYRDALDSVKSLIKNLLVPSLVSAWSRKLVPNLKVDAIERMWQTRGSTQVSRQIRRNVVLDIIGQGGLFQLDRFSKAWHERVGHLAREGRDLPKDIRFPALIEQPLTLNGITYTPLLTPAALDAEHEAMSHCINTYADSCATGRQFAFHVNGKRIDCTMTIGRDSKGALRKDSARGKENEIAPRFDAAADALIAHLNKNEFTEPVGGEEVQELIAKRDGPSVWLRNPAIAEKMAREVFQSWMPILPSRLRAATPEALFIGPFRDAVSLAFRKTKPKERDLPLAA